MIEITESAARVIDKQLDEEPKPGGGLRIAVKAGGCSGFSYTFAWDAAANDTDQVFEGTERREGVHRSAQPEAAGRHGARFRRGQPDGDEFHVEESAREEHVRLRRIVFGLG